MNNKVIKVLDREHGKKVIKFWKQYCDTIGLEGDGIGDYYGVIDGNFSIWNIYFLVKDWVFSEKIEFVQPLELLVLALVPPHSLGVTG